MGDIILLWFFQNVLIFCWLFWILTFCGEYFYTINVQFFKNHLYECGFKILNDIDIQIHFNFILLASFLVLYDVEFMLLIPIVFNTQYIGYIQFFVLISFFFFFLFSLIYDWHAKALNWQL